ncbi:hypothetical protein EJB05_12505 [Eragrostis curvula]|uniref:Uncharacterized protein n=1 Tax=Eragrostis curvula TaxID=38414 RepID=A0A5J9VTY3_9POAL|nr:hypothetical protein EJB05_12505 [Eragrostis curvula]
MENSASPFEDNAQNGDKTEELSPAKSTLTEAQKDAKRARERDRYAKMTPEQKKDKRNEYF